jgi:hypothetical protein
VGQTDRHTAMTSPSAVSSSLQQQDVNFKNGCPKLHSRSVTPTDHETAVVRACIPEATGVVHYRVRKYTLYRFKTAR